MIQSIWILTVLVSAVVSLGEYTPASSDYLFGLNTILPFLNSFNLFDGPSKVTYAPTAPTTNLKPKLQQIKYYNYYSVSTYCPYELKYLNCEHCKHFKKDVLTHTVLRNDVHNTLALIAVSENRKEIVVAYRGSMNLWNLVEGAYLTNGGNGDVKLHKGFYIATMSLYDEVVSNVRYLRGQYLNYKIVITGHSLGGAMGRITLYFLHILNQFPDAKYELYTYGEPRHGNKAYVDYLNTRTDTTARVVNRADIVPHIVPASLMGTHILGDYYMHAQTEFFIDGDFVYGYKYCDQTKYEDPNCSASLGPAYSVVDHETYFDIDYLHCLINNPIALTSLPFNIYEPTYVVPPLPKPIENYLGGLSYSTFKRLSPRYGK